MSYMKRSPCKKYFEKSTNKEELRKSLSATKFVPFRRPSDTTSESGSDDFKMEIGEDVSSSFSRSSSDSYTYGVNTRYQCIHNLKDLTEVSHLDEAEYDADGMVMMKPGENESLDDFCSRMNSRRKVKTRYQDSQDDDKTDNSCDSTTTKAHEEILRNANLLKQEQVANSDNSYNQKKSSYHHHYKQNSNNNRSITGTSSNNNLNSNDPETDETILLNEFDAILNLEENKLDDYNDDVFHHQVPTVSINNKTIARSSTENFLVKTTNDDGKTNKTGASPRFRRKTHVLKAASSIPSLIFSNKSFKQKSTTSTNNNLTYGQQTQDKFNNSNNNLLKKNSIDDDMFNISVTKARRSPLRILGNLVDDKIFRGRWSTAKRAKSTDEITWALAQEDNITNELQIPTRSGSTKQSRKKSFAGLLSSSSSSNTETNTNTFNNKKSYKSLTEKFSKNQTSTAAATDSNSETFSYMNAKTKFNEINRKPSSSYSEILTVSDSSLASLNDSSQSIHQNQQQQQPMIYNVTIQRHLPVNNNEIRAETLAEIEIRAANEILISSPKKLVNRYAIPMIAKQQKQIDDQQINDDHFDGDDDDNGSMIPNDDQNQVQNSSEENVDSTIGLFNLPLQMQKKFQKKAFSFTLMVVGGSGLGKSTFVNSMFLADIYNNEHPGPSKRATKTMTIEKTTVLLEENDTKIWLQVVDTPGYGDSLNNSNCWHSVENYIKQQHLDYLDYEFKPIETSSKDNNFIDSRVHCCLYFIEPTGHSLKRIDIEFMKHLQDKVNLIPIIAKADSFTAEELKQFKLNILQNLKDNKLEMYEFPPDAHISCPELVNRLPFAIISSNYVCQQNGKRFRGRKYPWGIVNIEDPDHCDFSILQELLIRRYMYELVDRTNSIFYERHRQQHLIKLLNSKE